MALTVYSFTQLVSNIATAMQASANAALNFTVGSVLRAITEATAGVILWLQAIMIQLLTLTRAATSVGTDLDSWVADYGLTRLAASFATGQVTFSRFTATLQAVIPPGATVQTADGTQQFAVAIDTSNAAWNGGLNGYVLPVSTSSISVPVQAVVAGSGGNVQAGSITLLSTPIPAVDTVSNASAFINGLDAETDAALRLRFVLYLASLSKGTEVAIEYAVNSVQQGLTETITTNEDYSGASQPGYFYVVVDDGTGFPSDSLLTNVSVAVEAVRGLTINYGVFAPVVVNAAVALTITSATGFTHSVVVAAVGTALTDFINGLPLGTSLPYTQIAAVVYSVPGVVNASSILLNGGTADVTATNKIKILAGTMTIA